MTTTDQPVDVHRLEQLVLERAKLTSDRDALIERISDLDAQLTAVLDKGTHAIADHKVTVTAPERIDSKAIAAAFPVAQFPDLYAPAINLDAVKEQFSPAELAGFKTAGRAQIRIR